MDEYKVTISTQEYRELCCIVGKMKAVISYLNETEFIDRRVLQAIIGPENFKVGDKK